ncbi:hypothetical protein BDW67DRAFT_183591 [Aspergillus spinulosporus]
MASPSQISPSSSSSSGLLSCLSLPSFLSLFLSCIQTPKNKGRSRRSPNPPSSTATTTNINDNSSNITRADGCTHSITACACMCTLPPVNTDLAKGSYPVSPASNNSNTISITQTTTTTTSIRIVDSETSSDCDSHSITSADTDANSVSDYGCGCGFGGDEHNCEDDIEDKNDSGKISLPTRPLPPVPVQRQIPSTSRKSSEVKTKTRLSCIEETIPEEEEEEVYLAQQRQEGDTKQHRHTTSRRKSMIELFHLSTSLSEASSSSRATSTSSGPGLSLSFSNLSFRFPMPPICGSGSQQSQTEKPDNAARGNPRRENLEHKRPKSMSALSLSCSASSATIFTSVSASPLQPTSTEKSYERCLDGDNENKMQIHSPTTRTTKKQRRMGTILFPPFAFLSRSSVGGAVDQESMDQQ